MGPMSNFSLPAARHFTTRAHLATAVIAVALLVATASNSARVSVACTAVILAALAWLVRFATSRARRVADQRAALVSRLHHPAGSDGYRARIRAEIRDLEARHGEGRAA